MQTRKVIVLSAVIAGIFLFWKLFLPSTPPDAPTATPPPPDETLGIEEKAQRPSPVLSRNHVIWSPPNPNYGRVWADAGYDAVKLHGEKHEIPFNGRTKSAALLPPSFNTKDKQIKVIGELLGYGRERFEAALRAFDQQGVLFDRAAVRAVRAAYAKYEKTLSFLIEGQKAKYDRCSPQLLNARFWNTLHPTLGCHDTARVGMAQDGGRFVCNGKALGFDGVVNVMGFGSNNQWEWEEALVHQKEFRVHSMLTADCTVQQVSNEAPELVTFVPLCVSDSDDTRTTRIGSLPSRLNLTKVALLKLDVEGYEFKAVPDWLRQTAARETTLQVQQVQIEFHRLGWKRNVGTSWESLMCSHLLWLHFYALGFIPVQYERNHMDDCCYEYTFVNAAWYVTAEYDLRHHG